MSSLIGQNVLMLKFMVNKTQIKTLGKSKIGRLTVGVFREVIKYGCQ